jgi:hypothetical protein
MTGARFQLDSPAGGDVLGIWDAAPRGTAFGPSPTGEEVWRVELPTGRRAALADRWRAVRAAVAAARESDRRLTEFVRGAAPGGPPVAFSSPATPEEELASALAGPGAGEGVPAFGIWSRWLTGWQESAREAREFLARAAETLSGIARVETVIGGAFVGRSVIRRLGSAETVWSLGVGRDEAGCHLGSVGLALATRRAWVRLAGVLVVGAAGLIATLASGGWLAALPAVWRFVRRILTEVRGLLGPALV